MGQRRLDLRLCLLSRSRPRFREEAGCVGQTRADGFLLTRVAALDRKDRVGCQSRIAFYRESNGRAQPGSARRELG